MPQMTAHPQDLPPDASWFARIRTGLHALWVLKDENADPYYARIFHLSFDRDTYAQLADRLRRTGEGRRLLDERRTIPGANVDLDTLASLPEGTLGHRYARHFAENSIEPFTFEFPLRDDADFLNKRYRETHDIHHLITGYGIDPIGEIELQAYYAGNLGFRHAALIMVVSLPVGFKHGGLAGVRDYVRRMRAAYRRGKSSRPVLEVPFDELWALPVAEIAERYCAPAST